MPSTKATYISVPAKSHGDGPGDRNLEKPASAPTKLSRRHTRHSIKSTDRFDDKLRHPWEKRKALSEIYDQPVTGREGWWRTNIRETPIPGSYEMESQGLFYDIDKKQNTYRFKSDGRKINPLPHYKGPLPSPGEYEHTTFLDSLEKRPGTYNFKTGERHQQDFLNFGLKDKDINISPAAYGVENYLTLTVDRQPSKHPMFKSQAKRFPTIQFKPKDGPAPGNYEQQDILPSRVVVSSCFKSKTPRFSSSHTTRLRVPGPGTYDSTSQYPYKGTVAKMGRQHGLFFSSAFQA